MLGRTEAELRGHRTGGFPVDVISREARKYKWRNVLEPRQKPVGKNAAGLATALTFTEEAPDTDLALAGLLDPALV
jgi:hypothetical protein